MCVIPRDHLWKVGQTCGRTAKIQSSLRWLSSRTKLQTALSPRSERVERPDFGGDSIGDQSFVSRRLLCNPFWSSKTLIGLFSRLRRTSRDRWFGQWLFALFRWSYIFTNSTREILSINWGWGGERNAGWKHNRYTQIEKSFSEIFEISVFIFFSDFWGKGEEGRRDGGERNERSAVDSNTEFLKHGTSTATPPGVPCGPGSSSFS